MSVFTEAELAFLQGERRLARLATVGRDGTPHIAPVGWSLDKDAAVVRIGGNDLRSTKKFRDVARTGRGPWSSTTCCRRFVPAGSRSAAAPSPWTSPRL